MTRRTAQRIASTRLPRRSPHRKAGRRATPYRAPARGTKNAMGGAASRVKLKLKNIMCAPAGGLRLRATDG